MRLLCLVATEESKYNFKDANRLLFVLKGVYERRFSFGQTPFFADRNDAVSRIILGQFDQHLAYGTFSKPHTGSTAKVLTLPYGAVCGEPIGAQARNQVNF